MSVTVMKPLCPKCGQRHHNAESALAKARLRGWTDEMEAEKQAYFAAHPDPTPDWVPLSQRCWT